MKRSIFLLVAIGMLVGCGYESKPTKGAKGPSAVENRNLGLFNHDYSYESDIYKVEVESVANITTHGTVVDIALSPDGNIAYLASGEGGLEVIDISIPESPRLVHSYDLDEYVNYVQVTDGRVYVANLFQSQAAYNNLYAFALFDPYKPKYIGYSKARHGVGHSRVKQGKYLYEVGQEGLQIHHASPNSIYYPAGGYYLHGTSYALAVHNNYIFVANGRDGLRILRANTGALSGHMQG